MTRTRTPDGRVVVEEVLDGVKVTTVELDVMTATDMLPELLSAIAPAYGAAQGGAALGDALAKLAAAMCGGKLSGFLPGVLAGTSMVVPDEAGKLTNRVLSDRKSINAAFAGRKKLLFPVVRLAVEVNFQDFYEGLLAVVPEAAAQSPTNEATTA